VSVKSIPAPLPDADWEEIKRHRPQLPDQARKPLEHWIAYYGRLQRQASSLQKDAHGKKKPASKKIEELQRPASQLSTALTAMDIETMMAVVTAGTYRPDVLILLHGLRKQLPSLVKLLRVAEKNVKRRKSGPDGEAFEMLVEQWDLILQHYGAGQISRPNFKDVEIIARAAAKTARERKIGDGTLDRAVKRVITARNKREARVLSAEQHLHQMRERLSKAVYRLQAHIIAAQEPDAARRRLAEIKAGKTEFPTESLE
jgi:hypothetical protein